VDSALLRFLSKQKRLKEDNKSGSDFDTLVAPSISNDNPSDAQQKDTNNSNDAINEVIDRQRSSLEFQQVQQPQDSQQQQQYQQQQQQSPQSAAPRQSVLTAESSYIPSPDDSLDLWLGQFNQNRVANLLLSLGEDLSENLAYQAGDSVQNHVLTRTARRRVREFLKERDTMWVEGLNDEDSNVQMSTPINVPSSSTTIIKHPEYGFSDVIDVLTQNGLTAKDIATILIHTPSIALMMPRKPVNASDTEFGGESIEETTTRALSELLCGTLNLRRYDARKVLRNCPGLLTKRGSRSGQQVVSAMAKMGVSTSSIARDKTALPTLLSRSPAYLFRLIAFLSSDAIRMPIQKIGPLLRRSECLELLDEVAPIQRLQASNDPTNDAAIAGTAETRILPAFVGRSLEQRRQHLDDTYSRMSSTAWTLRNEIGTKDLGKVIAAYPSVLLLNATEQILPVASYLMDGLGIWEDDLARVLHLYPTLLGMPISDMEKVVDFILEQGVERENLPSIFRSFPSLLTLDIEKDMLPVIDFLRSIGIKNVGRFISRLPPILGYSVDRELKPKWEVVDSTYTYTTFELSKFPAFFSYPLERVIKARFEYLQKVKNLPISLIAPDLVLRYGDQDFAVKVAGDSDDGVAFSQFLKDRQPHPSANRNKRQNRSNNMNNKERASQE